MKLNNIEIKLVAKSVLRSLEKRILVPGTISRYLKTFKLIVYDFAYQSHLYLFA